MEIEGHYVCIGFKMKLLFRCSIRLSQKSDHMFRLRHIEVVTVWSGATQYKLHPTLSIYTQIQYNNTNGINQQLLFTIALSRFESLGVTVKVLEKFQLMRYLTYRNSYHRFTSVLPSLLPRRI